MDTIQAAIDTGAPGSRFQIFSGILKASRSDDGRMRLHGVASSTTKDLHGDTMESSALEDMERAANNNLTIFLNHSYEVPEDVAGSVERARMATRSVDHLGNPNYDLDFDIVVNSANPRAVKAFEAIENGTKLGLSIGALIPDGGAIRDKKSGSYLIQHVELLETSLVGIPANPRSWVEYAAKSLRAIDKDAVNVPLGQPTLTLDGSNYRIEGSVDGLMLTNSTTTSNSINYPLTTTILTTGTVSTSGTAIFDGTTLTDQPPVADVLEGADVPPDGTVENGYQASCPDCSDDGVPCSKHKAVEPDVADAQVTIIQIDTDNGSSGEPSGSAPEEGQSTDPDGDYAAAGDDAVTPISQVLSLLRSTTGELVTARTEAAELRAQLSALTGERDSALEERDRVLNETREILDKVADAPLVRRAVAVEAQRELHTRFAGYFSDDLLKMLEK